jgi:NitT/TauT family transport system ATP-binding protein
VGSRGRCTRGTSSQRGDRINLLSARPGRTKEDFEVKCERPRDPVALREDPECVRLYSHIWHSLGEEFRLAKEG